MHILYYHLYFNTRQTPGGTRSYEMAKRLVERGHTVTIICGSRDGRLNLRDGTTRGIRKGNIDGINVIEIYLPQDDYHNFLKRGLGFIKFGLRGIKQALRLDYDILFATSTPLTAGIPGVIMKYFRRKPFIFEVRDLWPELPREMGVIRNPFVLTALSFLEWITYKKADACIGLSPGIVQGIKLRSRKSLPVTMIPNASDLDLFNSGKQDNRNIKGVNKNNTVAVFTGAHGIANGLDSVLDAAKCLKDRNRLDIKLLFIGEGQKKPDLIERVRREKLENCIFMDTMIKSELAHFMKNVDVGLMVLSNVPAFYYGTSPNKFFDYIASGLPVVNNYPGWVADLITEYNCGIAVKPDDPDGFAGALVRLADNHSLRKKMGENARKLAAAKFDREKLAEHFIYWIEKTYEEYCARYAGISDVNRSANKMELK